MHPVAALFGVASAACLLTAAKRDGRSIVAAVLAATWAAANLGWYANALAALPIADLIIGLLVLSLYEAKPSAWLRLAIAITAARLGAHLAFSWTGWYTGYAWAMNLTFAAHIINTGDWNGLDFGPLFDRVRGIFGGGSQGRAVCRARVST